MCIGWETFIQVPYWKAASTVALDVPDNTFKDSWNIFNPEKLWYPPHTHTHCCTPTHPKPLAFGLLRHLSCELKIHDPNPCWFLSSMLSTGFTLIHASLFGSLKEMKIAVLCSLALWFVADLFSTKCAPKGLFCFDLASEDLLWRLFRVFPLKKQKFGVPFAAQWLTNQTRIHEDAGSILGLTRWVKDPTLPWAVM